MDSLVFSRCLSGLNSVHHPPMLTTHLSYNLGCCSLSFIVFAVLCLFPVPHPGNCSGGHIWSERDKPHPGKNPFQDHKIGSARWAFFFFLLDQENTNKQNSSVVLFSICLWLQPYLEKEDLIYVVPTQNFKLPSVEEIYFTWEEWDPKTFTFCWLHSPSRLEPLCQNPNR